MKHFSLSLIFVLLSAIAKAQHFSLDELQRAVSSDNWSEVNKLLIAKGWEFYDSKKENSEGFKNVTWTYNKNSYADKAEAWFNLYQKEGESKISIQLSLVGAYDNIQSQLDRYGYKMTGTDIENSIASIYYTNGEFNMALKSQKNTRDGYNGSSRATYYVNIGRQKSGVQKEYYPNGKLKSEYVLEKGELNGYLRSYYEDGKLQIEANYVNGLIDGMLTYYETKDNIYVKSEYRKGKRNGSYELGRDVQNGLYREYGFYKDSIKDGKWRCVIIDKNGTEKVHSYVTYINGLKEGPAIDVMGDSIFFGTYKNGKLDGPCKLYRDYEKMILGGVINTDTTFNLVGFVEGGTYVNGEKEGKWIEENNNFNKTYETGLYKNGKRQGKWVKIQNDNTQDFYGQVIYEVNFTDDEPDGVYTKYIHKKEDTVSGREVYKKALETVKYSRGKKFGKYILRDEDGNIFVEGEYMNGKRTGVWKMQDKKIEKGLEVSSIYSDDELQRTVVYDPIENSKMCYDFTQLDGKIRCKVSIYEGDIKRMNSEFLVLTNGKTLKDVPEFYDMSKDSTLKDGRHLLFDKEGRIEKEWYFSRNKPVGLWKMNEYDKNIFFTKDFMENEKETYYNLDNEQPYTGTLEYKYEEEKEIETYYIKNGDIQKIEYRDFAGKLIDTIKFKKGVPQKKKS